LTVATGNVLALLSGCANCWQINSYKFN